MRRASEHFTDDDRARIAQAVAHAETRTTAEIVPAVATASGRYDRAEDLFGVLVALVALVLAWLLFQREDPGAGGWDGLQLTLSLPALVAIVAGGFVVGAVVGGRWTWVRRMLTPRSHLAAETHARAAQLFFDRRVHHTAAACGLLIFVSLFERRAVILADETVYDALGGPAIDDACRALTAAMRSGDVTAALCGTIDRLGATLGERLPDDAAAANELRDVLITVD